MDFYLAAEDVIFCREYRTSGLGLHYTKQFS